MTNRLALTLATGTALAAAWTGTAAAQTAPLPPEPTDADGPSVAPDDVLVGEIIVTAQRREQRLQDVPIAVSAYSGDDLAARQINDLSDLNQVSPSVTFTQSTNALNSSVNIRGVGTSVFSSAVEPSVSFIVDGVVLSRQGQAFTDLIDIDRVEILRGPQSTLFGKNASAGVINVVTKRPSKTFEAEGDVLIAEQNEYRVRGSASGPLTDKVGVRLTGFYTDVGGFIENVFDGRKLNGSKSYGGRARIEFDVGALNLLAIGDYRKGEDDCCQYQARLFNNPAFLRNNAVLNIGPENRQVNVNAPVFNNTESYGGSLEANLDIGDHTLTSITAYREWTFDNNIDVDGTPGLVGGITGFDLNRGATDLNQFTQELRLTSPSGGRFEYIVGAFFFDLNLDRRFERALCLTGVDLARCPQISVPLIPGVPLLIPLRQSNFFDGRVVNRNYAAFADLTFNVTDKFTLIGGIRVLREELDVANNRPVLPLFPGDGVLNGSRVPRNIFVDENGDGVLDPIVQVGSVRDTAVTGRGVAQYRFTPDFNVYASYSRGYKGPTADVAFDPDFSPGRPRSEFPFVRPETSNAYEVGTRFRTADRRATLNLVGFWTEFDDFQAQGFDAAAASFVLSNVGQVRTRGVELEFTLKPSTRVTIGGGGTYTDAEIRSFPNGQCFTPAATDPGCVNGVKDLSGARLANAPEFRGNLNIRYDQPIGDRLTSFVQATGRFQSDTQFSISQNPDTIQDGFGIVDLSVGFGDADGRYLLTGFVRNVFDTNYTSFLFSDPLQTAQVNIDQYAPKDADRYFGGSFRFRF